MRLRWFSVCIAAALYALALNSGWLIALAHGDTSPAYLQIENTGSSDQSQYFAFINTIGRGTVFFGNAALMEHENDPGGVLYGPMIPGLAKLVTGLSTPHIAMIMDLLCPILGFLLLWGASRKLLGDLSAFIFTVLAMNVLQANWLRQVSPQWTLLFLLAYIAVYLRCARHNRTGYLLRGAIIGMLLFVQIQEALYLLIVEGCDALYAITVLRREWNVWLRSAVAFLPAFLLFFLLRVWVSLRGSADVIADTQRRFGLIPSHLPTYPAMQAAILIALAVMATVYWKKHKDMQPAETRVVLLIVAAFLALNQSFFHGFDAMFRSYYRQPFRILLWLMTVLVIVRMFDVATKGQWSMRRRLGYGILTILFITSMTSFVRNIYGYNKANIQNVTVLQEQSVPELITWLNELPGRQIVAAPFLFADLIPALTQHSVLLNHYARYGVVSDAELADRFLLERALFPDPDPTTDDPDLSIVFGQAPGNLGARRRTWCKMKSFWNDRSCNTIQNSDAIVHQDLFHMMQTTKEVDKEALLKKYSVNVILAPESDRQNVPTGCHEEQTIGTWKAYRCT